MCDGDQLNLLAWTPPTPSRQIILFPLTNRIGKVRHTASKLQTKHGDEATLYWKQVMASNRKHLERVGLSSDEVDVELRRFFEAVQAELVRITYFATGNGNPKGAA